MPGITPAMALRAQQMSASAAAPSQPPAALQRQAPEEQSQSILDRSPMSMYSPATEGDAQWGRRPSHASSSGLEEFDAAAERSAELPPEGALPAEFEMLSSDAAEEQDASRSTNATHVEEEEEEDVSRDTLSALNSDMARSKSGSRRGSPALVSPRSPAFGGAGSSGGAARAPSVPQRKTRGRKDRSPVLSYADGEEEEQRLVALQAGPSDLQRMSSLGPKLKKNSPAPWELGAEEEEEMPSSGSKYSRGGEGRSSSSSRPSQSGDAPSSSGSRGFGWPRPSTDASRVPKSPAYPPPSMPSSDTRGSLASSRGGGGAVDLASEASEHELEATRRSRSKSVSSSAAGMLKGLGLAASATPAGKRGKFAKAFGRKGGAPAVPGAQAQGGMSSAPSWHSAAGSEERGNSLSLPGSTSDEFVSPSSPPMRAHSPLAPQSYAASSQQQPGGLPVHPLASTSAGSMSTATSTGTITGGSGGRGSTSAESGGGTSVQSSTRSSGPSMTSSTAATSPASAAPQHLSALGTAAAPNGPNIGGLSAAAAGASTRGLKEPAFLPRTPSPAPRSPNLAPRALQTPARSPSGNIAPRNAGGVGYKRSSTFLADGQLVPRGPSPGTSPLPSPNMSASGQFTFPNPNSRSTSASGHMSPESYMGAPLEHPNASTSQLDLRTSSATPTSALLVPPQHGADASPRGLSPSLMSGSPGSLNMSRAASFGSMNGAPPMPMPMRSSSTGGGGGSEGELPPPIMPGASGMSSLPSVGAHEGVPYKLISLQEARELQERERAARAVAEPNRFANGPQPSSASEGRGIKNKKSGFMRMFGKEKNAEEELDSQGMSSRPSQNSLEDGARRESKSTTSGSVHGNAGVGRMPSFMVNGSAAPAEETTAAPALSLRPVSSMFLGFGAEMLDPAALGITADESDKAAPPPTSTLGGLAIPEEGGNRLLPLPSSPALTNRSGDSHSSGGGSALGAAPAGYSNGSSGNGMSPRKAPPAGLALSSSALRQPNNSAPPRTSSSVRSSELGSPSYASVSHDIDAALTSLGAPGSKRSAEEFVSPMTSPMTPAFASSDAGMSSLGHASTHGQQHSIPASSRSLAVTAHSRLGNASSSSSAAARPHSSASTYSESGSSALALSHFPPTPATESTATLSPSVGAGGNSAAAVVRTRALEIEAAIAELAAELTALRTAAGAASGSNDSLLAPASPMIPSSPIPPCESCGCNCAEQKRAQALNEAAVLKSVR
jgi:hypothetical protein